MIVVNGVSKSFNIQRSQETKQLEVLKDVTCNVVDGEVFSIIGPSGCGKTTLLRIIAGLEIKDEGSVRIDDKEIAGPGSDRGFVFQTFNLFPWMSVRENVEFGLYDLPPEQRSKRVNRYIELVGLSGFENYHPHQLSGGMQQRVGMARALAVEPKVLLLDEPLANVDSQTAESLADELLKIFSETQKTVIYVTHNIDEALYISDRVAVMSPRPGTIRFIEEVNLPKPRWESDVRVMPEFGKLRSRLKSSLQVVN
jgi:NitT/TauT family transport system ATP-binding protein